MPFVFGTGLHDLSGFTRKSCHSLFRKPWWAAGFCGLLKCISDLDQLRFAEGAGEERDPNRQIENISSGNRDVWISRNRVCRRITAREVIAIDPVSGPRWSTSRRNHRIEPVLPHYEIDSLRARKQVILTQSLNVWLTGERSLGFGFDHDVLAEVGHLAFAILFVE